ncbi:hypothetical protein [Actinomadura violacea]|uniref:Integral membrane protein n=1 Tax=Actinomadura violacea TaxID=2819934 RepID=A0ABS3RXT3_9ACTN|nr:hypothetical protein [Actinomadura violacea]MBO2461576.1 hypothetical protein [Actinomadura violacea]
MTARDSSPATVVRLRDEERLLRLSAVAGVLLTWSGFAAGKVICWAADGPPMPRWELPCVAALSLFGPGCWVLTRTRYVLARRRLRAELGRMG